MASKLERAIEALDAEIEKLDRRSAAAIRKQIDIIRHELRDLLEALSDISVGNLPWSTPSRRRRKQPARRKR